MSKVPSVLTFPQDKDKFPIIDIVYPDTNFILKLLIKHEAKHPTAEALFTYLMFKNNKIKFLLSTLVVDEFWWALLNNLYKSDNNTKLDPNRLKWDKSIIAKYADRLKKYTQNLFKLPLIELISMDKSLSKDALENMTKFNMAPRDSFHLAVANSNHANAFISNDTDFESIESETIENIIKI